MTILADFHHSISPTRAISIQICADAEREFRLCSKILCSSDNLYTTVPKRVLTSIDFLHVSFCLFIKKEKDPAVI